MKAIRVSSAGGPEVLKFEDVPDLKPAPDEVLVKIEAAGVNPVDTYIRQGNYPGTTYPYTPGFDAAGVVAAIGGNVKKIKKGDRVYTAFSVSGTYAEYSTCKEEQVHLLPANVSFEAGAALNIPYGTAYYALVNKAQAKQGETVLIHGASGGVGIAAVQIARSLGLKVIGTAGTPRGNELVLKEGAHHVLDHTDPSYLDELKKLTNGIGPNIILEMLANVNLNKDLGAVSKLGRIVIIGSRGTVEIDPRLAMKGEVSIHGMIYFAVSPENQMLIHTALSSGLENGTLRPVIGKCFPLKAASEAHIAVMQSGAFGKIILKP